jgi:hypothetical protein
MIGLKREKSVSLQHGINCLQLDKQVSHIISKHKFPAMKEGTLKRYDKLVSKCSRFDRKGKTVPHTSANGYMFSLLNKEDELGIRFSKDVQEKYLNEYDTTLYKSHNAVMKGYILISEEMLQDLDNVVKLLDESYDYVMSLKAK